MMIGPILLLAAMISPSAQTARPALDRAPTFRSIGGATARATVSIRIISGVEFGPGHSGEAPGAIRRAALLTDPSGSTMRAELLEFQ